MKIRAWGPLFALLALFAAGLTGVALQHSKYDQPEPPKAEERNRPTAKTIIESAPDKGDKKGKDEKGWTDPLLVLFNGLLTLFTWLLYRATQGLFKETAGLREAAAEQSRDMKASIAVASRAAEAAEAAADASHRGLILQFRPKLVVRHIKESAPKADFPFTATIFIANVGGASATIIDNKIVLKCGIHSRTRNELTGAFTFEYPEEIRPGEMVGPITIKSGKFVWTMTPPNTPLIYGYILYRDDIGIDRRTAFYRHYAGSWELNGPGGHPDQEYQD